MNSGRLRHQAPGLADRAKPLKKLSSKDLPRFIAPASSPWVSGSYRDIEKLGRQATLSRMKIDRKKIEADVRKSSRRSRRTKTAWPFPTGAKAPAAKSSKKGKK
jgi:hypothetical protein